jgi:hypothetical protein
MKPYRFIARDDLFLRTATDQFKETFLTNLGLDPNSGIDRAFAACALRTLINIIEAEIPYYEFAMKMKGPEENG